MPCQPPWLSQGVFVVRWACETEFGILHCQPPWLSQGILWSGVCAKLQLGVLRQVNHHGYIRAFCGQVGM